MTALLFDRRPFSSGTPSIGPTGFLSLCYTAVWIRRRLDARAAVLARAAGSSRPFDRNAAPFDRDSALMDAFSQILRALRLESGIFLDAEFTAPWCIDSAPGTDDVRRILPSAEHVAIYHLLVEGRCNARLPDDGAELTLQAGDLIMFPHGDGHLLGSDLKRRPVSAETLVQPSAEGGLARIVYGGGGARTRFVCGYLACDSRMCRPMIDALPRMLRVPLGESAGAAWIISTIQRAAEESRAPRAGTEAVLVKLAELLFVEAIRCHIE